MNFILGIHLVLCVSLICLVLLQQGKGADIGVAFGGGSNTLFGAAGANNLMVKITTGVAIAFMVSSIFLIRGYSAAAQGAPREMEIRDPQLDTPAVASEAAPAAPTGEPANEVKDGAKDASEDAAKK